MILFEVGRFIVRELKELKHVILQTGMDVMQSNHVMRNAEGVASLVVVVLFGEMKVFCIKHSATVKKHLNVLSAIYYRGTS